MARAHRSIIRRAGKVDAEKVANDGEDYLYGFNLFKRDLGGVTGLVTPARIKAGIKRIDDLEKEALRFEDKIDRLMERRAVEAVKLEQDLQHNYDILQEYLHPDEMREFWG
jgi:hypothetical protein